MENGNDRDSATMTCSRSRRMSQEIALVDYVSAIESSLITDHGRTANEAKALVDRHTRLVVRMWAVEELRYTAAAMALEMADK